MTAQFHDKYILHIDLLISILTGYIHLLTYRMMQVFDEAIYFKNLKFLV